MEIYARFVSATGLNICNSVCIWHLLMGWIPRCSNPCMAFPSNSSILLVSVFPHMSVLFHILRRTQGTIFCASFFLSYIWAVNCDLGILNFWVNIHLSMSACQFCSILTGLHHSGYFIIPSISLSVSTCYRF